MANEFIIKNGFHSKGDSQITGSLNVKDSLTVNGSAVGAAFPFVGDAQITGSLVVSGSILSPETQISSSFINLNRTGPIIIGPGADATAVTSIAIGKNADAGNGSVYYHNVVIGDGASIGTTSGNGNVSIGSTSNGGNNAVNIGYLANAASNDVAIGQGAG